MQKTGSIVEITQDGVTRTIDLTKIEELVFNLQDNWTKGVYTFPDSYYEVVKGSSKDQLEYLVTDLMSISCSQARSLAFSYTEKFAKLAESVRNLKKVAAEQGVDLFSTIPEGSISDNTE